MTGDDSQMAGEEMLILDLGQAGGIEAYDLKSASEMERLRARVQQQPDLAQLRRLKSHSDPGRDTIFTGFAYPEDILGEELGEFLGLELPCT